MKMRISVTIFVLCIAIAKGNRELPGMLPYVSYGDLNMPGFTELNTALNSGSLDLAPSLARLPAFPTSSLTNVIAQFLCDVASECTRRGETVMAESVLTLQAISPEIEALALEYGQLSSSWSLLGALRAVGVATVAQRTRLEVCAEAWELAITPLLDTILERVHALGNAPAVLQVQSDVVKLYQDFNSHYATLVADSAEMLRQSSFVAAAILNHRVLAEQGVQNQEAAAAALQQHLEDAQANLANQVTDVTATLVSLHEAGLVSRWQLLQLEAPLRQVSALSRREARDLRTAGSAALEACLQAHRALHAFY